MNVSISSRQSDALTKALLAQAAAMKAQITPMDEKGNPSTAHAQVTGQDAIDKRLSPLAEKVDKSQSKLTGLQGLKENSGDLSAGLTPLSAVTSGKKVSSTAGITGTAGVGAEIKTHQIEVISVARACRWTIDAMDNYDGAFWTANSDVVANTVLGDPKTFDVSNAGPHLTITQGTNPAANITLADGDTLQQVVDKINTALVTGGLDLTAKIVVYDQKTGARRIELEAGSIGAGKEFVIVPQTEYLADDIKISPSSGVVKATLKNVNGQPWVSGNALSTYNGVAAPASNPFKINGVQVYPYWFDHAVDTSDVTLSAIVSGINNYISQTGVKATQVTVGANIHVELTRIDGGAGIDIELDHGSPTGHFVPPFMWKYEAVTDVVPEAAIRVDGGSIIRSQTNEFNIGTGLTLDVSNVVMPPSTSTVKTVTTSVSVLPGKEWLGLVKGLAEAYNDANAFKTKVDTAVDGQGVHTDSLYGSRELNDMGKVLANIKSHVTHVGGNKITWSDLGVTFAKGKMSVNESTFKAMQESTTDAEKVQAFLQGMSHNTGKVSAAGASGAVQAQFSSLKNGGGIVLNVANSCANHVRSVSVTYNGGARAAPANYTVEVTGGDGTVYTTTGGDFAFALSSGGDPKIFNISGVHANLANLSIDYHCPLDSDFGSGETDQIDFTYVLPNSTAAIDTKLEVNVPPKDASHMENITDVIAHSSGGHINSGRLLYKKAFVDLISTALGGGVFSLEVTTAGHDLEGMKLKFSSTGSALPSGQAYAFQNITIASGVGNYVNGLTGLEDRLDRAIKNVDKEITELTQKHDSTKTKEEERLRSKVLMMQMQNMLREINKVDHLVAMLTGAAAA